MLTRDDLITKWTDRWGFRKRGPFEGREQYAEAVVAFLETRDWAASYEVRIGKPQAQWTADEVRAFDEHLTRPRHRADATPVPAMFLEAATGVPTTLAALMEVAARAFDELASRLPPTTDGLPIFAHVLTLDGRLWITTCSSGNRLGVLKMAAQQMPLYGYVLVFDAFLHQLDRVTGKATKRDALIAHVGTRDDRHVVSRPYTVTGRRVRFDPEIALDMREESSPTGQLQSFVDPYAELFVSVPPLTRPQ